jgi:hypothetical protein
MSNEIQETSTEPAAAKPPVLISNKAIAAFIAALQADPTPAEGVAFDAGEFEAIASDPAGDVAKKALRAAALEVAVEGMTDEEKAAALTMKAFWERVGLDPCAG